LSPVLVLAVTIAVVVVVLADCVVRLQLRAVVEH
jgi:hypothetical protein